ncbi:GNAT family N-acetyltransferase [Paracraurococcus ruber]|uniref:N-acetyltransferase domain-containing protein n=1 Tax=Paracraurococcus ruber TaxID=77675 RepID=A0ABS1CYU8_9PROT|nr:GNAT family N-acetyltransferase [Paracraurococcus ruber]MBK1659491.1 hypothetical protein [Paracraurococcus ruber]TDG33636.1 GNAT family N-acetyltransferase [Paracraurococcus ruber]
MTWTVAGLERACLTALPAPRHGWDGPFVMKAFLGGTGRANSCCALDPSPDPLLADRVARIAARYHALGLPSRFRSTPLSPPGLEEALLALGHRADPDPTIVFAGAIGGVAADDPAVRDEAGPTAAWMGLVGTAEYQTSLRQAEKLRNPEFLAAPAAWLVLRDGGVDAACLFTVADGDHCGVFDLATRPDCRRRGLAARLIRAAAAWGRARGATTLYAQVAASNAASGAVQRGLGLAEAYRYRYFVLPPG